MKYVFGPVPSRRLGKSLGIDPIPLKTCNWNCVYCQLGRTSPLTLERGDFAPRQVIVFEVEKALRYLHSGEADWITFVGSGEPTLHRDMGWMIRQVKACSDLPVAVITNGSLLFLQEVREELSAADAVMPTLDAGNDWLYRLINRAAPRFSFDRLVQGLIQFRKMYSGKLWVETMLVGGMNDTESVLQEIALILESVRPDLVHITLPVRPPAEAGIRPADEMGLERARTILGEVAPVSIPEAAEAQALRVGNLSEIILSIVTRHPMQEKELIILLNRWSTEEVLAAISELVDKKQVFIKERNGQTFLGISSASDKKKKRSL
jgi:wyosine [tRNA(Phe)-imidazoG37] synthetase (radical SAM superfamily)